MLEFRYGVWAPPQDVWDTILGLVARVREIDERFTVVEQYGSLMHTMNDTEEMSMLRDITMPSVVRDWMFGMMMFQISR